MKVTKHKLTDAQKAHWDWESGYGNMEAPIVIPESTRSTKKIVVFTIVLITLIIFVIKVN